MPACLLLFFLFPFVVSLDLFSCTIPRVNYSKEIFLSQYLGQRGVIFTAPHNHDEARLALSEPFLLREFGNLSVTLASSNANSYAKRETSLKNYLELHMSEVTLEQRADELWYLFGDTLMTSSWAPLHATFRTVREVQEDPLIVWGVGGKFSGVPFHRHGPVYAEVVLGRKRWYISPPDARPVFSGNETTYAWAMKGGEEDAVRIQACTLGSGEILYLPLDWWHATLNLDPYTAFISTFTREAPLKTAEL